MYDDRRFSDSRYCRWTGIWNVHMLVCALWDKSMNTRENGGKVADHIIYKLEELKNIL